ncbi:acyl-CoA dehydrogenase family member 10 [Neohortaea acidophila]|uniref:Acyl-CoA dehydrogenase family member 10 n=1 Tax=Neohortaea acidophila TaxID=245834 RepID=A0A6A6PHV9_9PEZI|nr:acyl-CoA dehydrogenase family member 10 [Neohortaea acidophila]KAF2479376.1 acyl-CoA dehydrogenase family member 10 [Neohortaea acidophila]
MSSSAIEAIDREHPALSRLPPWTLEKLSPNAVRLIKQVHHFVETECIPAEPIFKAQLEQYGRWKSPPLIRELRGKAKEAGLFNLFLPKTFGHLSPGLTNLEYSCCAEIMGRCYWAAQTMNCHAPDTGNMELLAKYCNEEQKEKWLMPLLRGETYSAYSMTEPDKATSDATNIACRITRDPNDPETLIINGRKLYGNCKWNDELGFYILMACSDPDNPDPWKRHSTVIVPKDTPGFRMIRNLTIMGYDHAPDGHGEYIYENARVPAKNIILGEGRAFEIAQGRLGPGRIHHCMRLIGQTERAYELALIRATDPRKKPRGKLIGEFDSNIERLANMRLRLDSLRLVVLNAAHTMDVYGNKAGRYAIAQSKILVPEMAVKIIDECMQMYGGQGLTQHSPLPEMWTYARFVRIADGPDAAHRHQVGRDELKTASRIKKRHDEYRKTCDELCQKWKVKIDTRDSHL